MVIPLCFIPEKLLDTFYGSFTGIGDFLESGVFPNFSMTLKQARINYPAKKYLTYSLINDLLIGLIVGIFVFMAFLKNKVQSINPAMIGVVAVIMVGGFLFVQQIGYPQVIIKKRVQSIERNLLPALQNVLVQLRSGIPLFDVSVNIAASDYGEVSKEFMTVVKQINGGRHQVEAFERMAMENPSHIFRSAIWQLVNGMKTGSELSDVLREIIIALAEEEILQIEQYGATLSPMTMFYMIGAVILPALGVNFLIVLSSFMKVDIFTVQLIFYGVYFLVVFFQLIFFNIIKSKRPSLMER